MAFTAYTTSGAIELLLSSVGVSLRVDDDAAATADAIQQASADIEGACVPRYSSATLAANDWIARQAQVLGAYYLCVRRNNPSAKSLEKRYERVLKELEQVRVDGRQIPNAAEDKAGVPALSGQRVSMTPMPNRLTTEPSRSTGTPEDYRRIEPIVDPADYFDYGI